MRTNTRQILNNVNLRYTASRSAILDLFLTHSHALSHAQIEKLLSALFDRVTIYRTLKAFLYKGIVHKILDDVGKLKYALCNERCSVARHNHNHAHFKCIHCKNTHCLYQVDIPTIKLPQGYHMEAANLLIQGICTKCR